MKARIRYSLRLVFLGVTIAAVLLALWSNAAKRQRQTVAEIRSLGGSVAYDHGLFSFLEPILGIDYVADVNVVYLYRYDLPVVDPGHAGFVTDIDALIPHLQRLPSLKRVVGIWHHGDAADRLRKAFPGLKIDVGMVASLRELTRILMTIQDERDAVRAAPRLKEHYRQHFAAIRRSETEQIHEASEDAGVADAEWDDAMNGLLAAMDRLRRKVPAAGKLVDRILDESFAEAAERERPGN
jgi:hypothetical protein